MRITESRPFATVAWVLAIGFVIAQAGCNSNPTDSDNHESASDTATDTSNPDTRFDSSPADDGSMPDAERPEDSGSDTAPNPQIERPGVNKTMLDSSQCGMSDKYFQAEVLVADPPAPLRDGSLSLVISPTNVRKTGVSPNIVTKPTDYNFQYLNDSPEPGDSALVFEDIPHTWCMGLEPGRYDARVNVTFEDGSVLQKSFAAWLHITQ